VLDLSKTGMYVPNDYVIRLCEKYPDKFLPSCSVHPYRLYALEQLERCHKTGARLIKWLPNAMGIGNGKQKEALFFCSLSRPELGKVSALLRQVPRARHGDSVALRRREGRQQRPQVSKDGQPAVVSQSFQFWSQGKPIESHLFSLSFFISLVPHLFRSSSLSFFLSLVLPLL
jgi:hypothetical protein